MLISNFFISVIAPLKNDEDIIESFLNETITVLKSNYQHYELILVDDGSSDNTRSIVEKLLTEKECVRYIRLSRSFGIETAIFCGLEAAIGDVVVTLEPVWDPPRFIPQIVEKVREIKGVIFGIKMTPEGKYLCYRLRKRIFDWFADLMLKFPPPRNVSYFIGLNRQAVNAVIQIKDEKRFISVFSAYIGFPQQIFPYEPKTRKSYSGKKFFESIGYAIELFANNTTAPLKIAAYIGLFISSLNMLFSAGIFLTYLFKKNFMEGWVASSFQSSVMFFIVSVILAGLVEYFDKLIGGIRSRPIYFIEEEKNSSVVFMENARKNVVKSPD